MFSKINRRNDHDYLEPMSAERFIEKLSSLNAIAILKQEHADILASVQCDTTVGIGYETNEAQTGNSLFFFLRNCLPTYGQADSSETPQYDDSYYFIDGYKQKQKFICCKNPNEDEIDYFWQKIWNENVKIIVTFSITSSDVTSVRYLKLQNNSEVMYKEFCITVAGINISDSRVMTILHLKNQNNLIREVQCFCYTHWSRDELCYDVKSIIKFTSDINEVNTNFEALQSAEKSDKYSPILIHCSDGLNRSASFCLLDISISIFEKFGTVCFPRLLKQFQHQKIGCIDDVFYYIFCNYVLYSYILSKMNKIRK
uniref:Putative tyrosine phosphatase protein n=1 Tax=Toxoneuron nigriceps polydnavirus TaxID=191766 RepID=Q5W3L0_9VIRU|nr:putative tyrosine phosphatase protein [Toxoneuron nigriceps polydnavirus]